MINDIVQRYLRFAFIPSALVFALGYLINANYYRSIGFFSIPFAKAQYIETGLTFVAFSFALESLLLVGILIKKTLRPEPSCGDYIYWIANTISIYIFILALVFYALFMDTYVEFHLCGSSFSSRWAFLSCFIVVPLGVITSSWVYNKSIKKQAGKAWIIVGVFTSVFVVSFAFIFMVLVFSQIGWLFSLIKQSAIYFICLFLLCLSCLRIVGRYKKNPSIVFGRTYFTASFIVLFLLLFMAVTEYSSSVLKFIPVSRGGVMPEYQISFTIKKDSFLGDFTLPKFYGGKNAKFQTSDLMFLVGEDNENFWISRKFPLIDKTHADVFVLDKSDIIFYKLSRVDVRNQ